MLPAAHRLKKQAEVKRVLEGGTKKKFGPLLFFSLTSEDPLRLAVVVSKKVSKLATRRNYLRRLLTELVRDRVDLSTRRGDVVVHILYNPTDPKKELLIGIDQWLSAS